VTAQVISEPQAERGTAAVRAAQESDLDALMALEAASFTTDRSDRRAFRHAVRSPSMSLLVLPGDGGLDGYAIIERRRGSDLGRLSSIAIRPERKGGGLGKSLLEAAELDARAHGCRRLRLEVRSDNVPAQRLYDRAGYRRFAVVEDYYSDGTAAWRYEKQL
jgi:ribosomal protein S18 acetylase RimI-like enzyme